MASVFSKEEKICYKMVYYHLKHLIGDTNLRTWLIKIIFFTRNNVISRFLEIICYLKSLLYLHWVLIFTNGRNRNLEQQSTIVGEFEKAFYENSNDKEGSQNHEILILFEVTANQNVYCSFEFVALAVRYLTKRFIGEYDSHKGKNLFLRFWLGSTAWLNLGFGYLSH